MEKVSWAILGSPGSNSSLRKLIGWQSEVEWKGGRKQSPLRCYSPVLVRMVRESGRMARIFTR